MVRRYELTKAEVRKQLVKNLERDLLGPKKGPDEEFMELPTQRYVIGILFPSSTPIGPEQDINNPPEGEDDEEYSPMYRTPLENELRPSSMGMSFIVDKNITSLPVEIRWATYIQKEEYGSFRRCEHTVSMELDVSADDLKGDEPLYRKDMADAKEFRVFWRTYRGEKEDRPVSVFLWNKETTSSNKAELSQRCMFSPSIRIEFKDRFIIARKRMTIASEEEDLKSLNLLYHDRHEFGVGHGCSIMWMDVQGNRCGLIETTFMPTYHWQPLSFREEEYPFYMKNMSEKKRKEQIQEELELLKSYEEWISGTFSEVEKNQLEPMFHETFDRHKNECMTSLVRIKKGIELLEDDQVFNAFCFMNEAMFLQRAYYDAAVEYRKEGKKFKDPSLTDSKVIAKHRWRPFQIAFILQAIPGIVNPNDDDRKIVDLLWIPTGGGKTEAYLGLAAFTMAYRRLKSKALEDYAGVSVMMRYTLRLLTIQQFQRAGALMCACEAIRDKNKAKWGEIPFLVGLFVGQSTTPNIIGKKNDYVKYNEDGWKNKNCEDTAYYALEYWKKEHQKPTGSNPFQLLYCPWCGEELTEKSYTIDDEKQNVITHCVRDGCLFKLLEIPAITVDEDVYNRLPSMVIGTVDKFAMLPFSPKIGKMFGHVDRYCPTHGFLCRTENHSDSHKSGVQVRSIRNPLNPPNLIIQDELHLINGPLGSMVGIYESTVDRLCSRNIGTVIVKPKVIASTATIRRARDQVWNIFARDVKRFPAPGTEFSDSFFVKEVQDDNNAKQFIGVFPSGIGQKTVMKRTLSSLLLSALEFNKKGSPVEDWDEYWTLVSYFNSIRELGSAKTTIEDDVNSAVKERRKILPIDELTSRINSKDLPSILAKLNIRGDTDKAVNILACSNMFSVGVDVQRLGLMVMNNQPKATSEYIQSTGRVGRNKSGLVIVLYNWVRPRDQSHYERFYDYHNRIQSYVEAMTVTPFSEGASERALHAQYVSMIRILSDAQLSRQSEAGNFNSVIRCSSASRAYEEWLEERMKTVTGESSGDLKERLTKFLDKWIDWVDLVGKELCYEKGQYGQCRNYLLRRIDDVRQPEDGGLKKLTPTSMRNVEQQVPLHRVKIPRSGR
ncbi:MAG: DISARM system helicase DrmA [Candidatus Freyarchaeum deiterrae]